MQKKAREGKVDENGWPIPIVCFASHTLIYSSEGLKPIENVKKGDSVYSWNTQTNKIELSKVTNTFRRKADVIYSVTVNNEIIFVTAEHPFFIKDRGWVKVKSLHKNDILQSSDSLNLIIKTITKIDQGSTVYNIEVSGNHNYFVTESKILVHNKSIQEGREDNEKEKTAKFEE